MTAEAVMIEEKRWKESVLRSLAGQSRTLFGVSDTTSAKSKPKLVVAEGKDLAEKSAKNLEEAIDFLFENRYQKFASPEDVLIFISTLAATVSDGLLPEGQPLFRTWETKFDQAPVIRIEIELKKFCQWFFGTIDSDAIVTAALVEKRLDGEIHPFADGCKASCVIRSVEARNISASLRSTRRILSQYSSDQPGLDQVLPVHGGSFGFPELNEEPLLKNLLSILEFILKMDSNLGN